MNNHKEQRMKKIFLPVLLCLAFFMATGCTQQAKQDETASGITELKTPAEKLGYAIGSDIGKNFKKNEMEIDQKAFIKGFEDGLTDAQPLLTPEEIKDIQQKAIADMRKKLSDKRKEETEKKKELAEKNKKEGEAFLAENGKKDGVVTTPSGLQYQILQEGDGPMPKETDRVTVQYAGKLLDGTEFDSSYTRGKPSTFGVKGVIAGWTEALQMMKTGSKWRLFIPSGLAYKERGAGQKIGPNATLIFDIELLSIENKADTKTSEKQPEDTKKKS